MKKKITALDVKQALLDSRFRSNLPEELLPDVQKFLNNPGCACNHPIYKKVMKEAAQQLVNYFPLKDLSSSEEMDNEKSKNEWTVINCSIDELASKLRKLPPGRKQVEIARWEDQVTVIINDLE